MREMYSRFFSRARAAASSSSFGGFRSFSTKQRATISITPRRILYFGVGGFLAAHGVAFFYNPFLVAKSDVASKPSGDAASSPPKGPPVNRSQPPREIPLADYALAPSAPRSKASFDQMEWFTQKLQNEICLALEKLEGSDGAKFKEDRYFRPNGGGLGITRVMSGGKVVEKAGVNVSFTISPVRMETIQYLSRDHPQLKPYVKAEKGWYPWQWFPADPPPLEQFRTASISLIVHPLNPFAPTIHMNLRYFEFLKPIRADGTREVAVWWFGGGTDLTPHYLIEEDCVHFHRSLKDATDSIDPAFYPKHKKECDEYFRIKHRDECRGIGGVFFENKFTQSSEYMFGLVKSVGDAFLPGYLPILEKRKDTPFTPQHRRWQELRHGRYVEFNLMYDRGTEYGLKNPSARVESILVSLPLTVRYEHNHQPELGSPEWAIQQVLRVPKDWLNVETKA